MGNHISTLGWILIGIVIGITVLLNVRLFVKREHQGKSPDRSDRIQNVRKTFKDPFWFENEKMQELSNRLDQIKNEKESTHMEHDVMKENGK